MHATPEILHASNLRVPVRVYDGQCSRVGERSWGRRHFCESGARGLQGMRGRWSRRSARALEVTAGRHLHPRVDPHFIMRIPKKSRARGQREELGEGRRIVSGRGDDSAHACDGGTRDSRARSTCARSAGGDHPLGPSKEGKDLSATQLHAGVGAEKRTMRGACADKK